MRGLLVDCKVAVRLYLRTPVSSLIAVVVLAVGMAFVGAFLSLYVNLALEPSRGLEAGDRVVTIAPVQGYTTPFELTERMSEELRSLEAIVGVAGPSFTVDREGRSVTVEYASRGFFDDIRPKLTLGRGFEAGEHVLGAEPVVVISDRYWRERYDRSLDVLGERVELFQRQLGGGTRPPTEFRIIGVMAPELRGLMIDDVDLWAPLERNIPFISGEAVTDYERARTEQYVRSLGRLRPGVTMTALRLEIDAWYADYLEANGMPVDRRIDVVRGVVRDISVHRDAERQLKLFLAGSVLLALAAGGNTSLFLLARAPGRRRELAIRLSIGAAIPRLARQLLTESGLLVGAGALLGLLASMWLASFLQSLAFLSRAGWNDVTLLDWRVLGLVAVVLVILACLASLAPILALKRLSLAPSTRRDAVRATVAQRFAGTTQIAVTGVLGGAAVAFGWFLVAVLYGEPGYELENRHAVLFVPSFEAGGVGGGTTMDLQRAVLDAARGREVIEALPDVRAVTFASAIPGGQQGSMEQRAVRDPVEPSREIRVSYSSIDSRIVDVLGLKLLYGRVPADNEIGASLVNRTLARRVFGRDDVVGESLDITGSAGQRTEIVGVLEDLSFSHPAADIAPILFMNMPQSIAVRAVIASSLPGAALQRQLQDRFDAGELEIGQPNSVTTLREFRERMIAPDRARGLLTIATAALVVLLTAFGFYGTQRYLVDLSRREYAIRAALGAAPKALMRLVLRRAIMLGVPGLVLGAPLAFVVVAWLRRGFLSSYVAPGVVTAAVVVGLIVLTLLASLGPARIARRTEPASLLRAE